MLIPAVVGNLFYFWMGVAVLLALWIPWSFITFKWKGKFTILPGSTVGAFSGDVDGSTRRALYIFAAVRVVLIVVFVVLGVLQIHSRHH